jgi:hypothetical protein
MPINFTSGAMRKKRGFVAWGKRAREPVGWSATSRLKPGRWPRTLSRPIPEKAKELPLKLSGVRHHYLS